MSVKKPVPRFGYKPEMTNPCNMPEIYGAAYAEVGVVPGDRVEMDGGYSKPWQIVELGTVLHPEDQIVKDNFGTSAASDRFVYARRDHDGYVDGWPSITLRKAR
jgi:hypothetical protein